MEGIHYKASRQMRNEGKDNAFQYKTINKAKGPAKKPINVRNTVRFDYNPYLCKDWHDNGYCAFGNSCLYAHDRGDYKNGWEMENDWNKKQPDFKRIK